VAHRQGVGPDMAGSRLGRNECRSADTKFWRSSWTRTAEMKDGLPMRPCGRPRVSYWYRAGLENGLSCGERLMRRQGGRYWAPTGAPMVEWCSGCARRSGWTVVAGDSRWRRRGCPVAGGLLGIEMGRKGRGRSSVACVCERVWVVIDGTGGPDWFSDDRDRRTTTPTSDESRAHWGTMKVGTTSSVTPGSSRNRQPDRGAAVSFRIHCAS